MKAKAFYIAGIFLLSTALCVGGTVQIDITEYGTYTNLDITGRSRDGLVWHVGGEEHLETTTNVPCIHGIAFGYRFQIIGRPESNTVYFVTLLPPEEGETSHHCIVFTRTHDETLANPFIGYRLDVDGPTPCGTYSLSIWMDGEMLCEKSFEVSSSDDVN